MFSQPHQGDIAPWVPSKTHIPADWQLLTEAIMKETPQRYALKMAFDAQGVGNLLASWGLPWQVVIAGYLWASSEKQIRRASLQDVHQILNHITQASYYIRAIEQEDLPLLLTPPYQDLGALLIAVAISYQELKMIQKQGSNQPYIGKMWVHIEKVGHTLLNIAKLLGLWRLKREIEDRIEQLRSPHTFAEMQREREKILNQDALILEDIRRLFLTSYQQAIHGPLAVQCIACGIVGMKRRMQDAHTTISSQKTRLTGFDLVTFNVAVPTMKACYDAFGILSQLGYIQDRVTDHLTNPKPNGYSYTAFGLVLKPQDLYTRELVWGDKSDRYVCQLQIATHLMQAIMEYGCLHPHCYHFYTTISQQKQMITPPIEALWQSEEGRVFIAMQKHLTTNNSKPAMNTPIVAYDKNRRPVALPRGATALDFAFALDHKVGEHAVDVIINNRKAPLYRVLDAGDIVEIITARRPQMDELSVENTGTMATHRRTKKVLVSDTLSLRGENLLHQVLERYMYELTPEELEHELHLLIKKHNLGPASVYLERLGRPDIPPYTPDWAAQEIMQQIEEHEEPLIANRSRSSWVAVPDIILTTNKRLFRQPRPCNLCQPTYPRDVKIIGRRRRGKGELIVHKESCPHLLEHTAENEPILIPMTWQQQPPPFKVTFAIIAQDRRELILDITRRLRRYTCNLVSIKASIISKLKEAHIHFTLEAFNDKEILDIQNELQNIENVITVGIDPVATPKVTRERLENLQEPSLAPTHEMAIDSLFKDTLVTSFQRKHILDNPFDISRPATGKMFFGRSEEMERMERDLCEGEHGKAFLLYGPRRSGKSSICKNFFDCAIRPPIWGVLFSLQNFTQHDEEAIFKHLSMAISREFEEQLYLSAPDWQQYDDDDPQTRFRRLLSECLAQIPGKRLILALDEFGGTLESYEQGILAYRFFTYWKELMNEIPQLSLILVLPTSSHRALASKDIVNAFSFANNLEVTFLDTESAQNLLVNPLQERNIGIFPSALGMAIKLTGRNPYYLTLLGQGLINLLNRDSYRERITDEDIRLVIDQIIMNHSSQNFDFLAKELQNVDELRVLEAIVELTTHPGKSKAQLKKIADWLALPGYIARRHLDRLRNGLILQQNGPASNPYYTFTIELVYRWLTANRDFFHRE